ncbi:MAG: HD domain-containing protein [Turicibacter sp.]|nr:HD domain-containing protein [Turicibacter sp.]
MKRERIDKVVQYISDCLEGNVDGHGADHSMRVYNNVMKLLFYNPNADGELCCVAGLVHDLIDDKVAVDVSVAKKELTEFLSNLAYSADFINQVFFIIENMSFRKGQHGIFADCLEGKIVQDADRLEAVGAVAIIRTAMYGAVSGRPAIYVTGDTSNDTMIGHFHAKLYRLADLMNTPQARAWAEERIAFMKQFEAQLISEIEI